MKIEPETSNVLLSELTRHVLLRGSLNCLLIFGLSDLETMISKLRKENMRLIYEIKTSLKDITIKSAFGDLQYYRKNIFTAFIKLVQNITITAYFRTIVLERLYILHRLRTIL